MNKTKHQARHYDAHKYEHSPQEKIRDTAQRANQAPRCHASKTESTRPTPNRRRHQLQDHRAKCVRPLRRCSDSEYMQGHTSLVSLPHDAPGWGKFLSNSSPPVTHEQLATTLLHIQSHAKTTQSCAAN